MEERFAEEYVFSNYSFDLTVDDVRRIRPDWQFGPRSKITPSQAQELLELSREEVNAFLYKRRIMLPMEPDPYDPYAEPMVARGTAFNLLRDVCLYLFAAKLFEAIHFGEPNNPYALRVKDDIERILRQPEALGFVVRAREDVTAVKGVSSEDVGKYAKGLGLLSASQFRYLSRLGGW